MGIKSRIKHLEKNLTLSSINFSSINFSELTDDELLAFIGDDYKWLSKLSDQELEEMIRNEH
jgi:hypothetical protein